MALVGLFNYCAKGGGSYVTAQYVPTTEVESFVPIVNETTRRLIALPNVFGNWYALPNLAGAERLITERAADTKQGVLFTTRLSMPIMPISPTIEWELEQMRLLRYFLIRFKDRAGNSWLMGDLDCPAEFDYDYSTTKTVVSFECKSFHALRHILTY